MTLPALKGKGLFVFSDPGGAKPLLALIKLSKSLTEYKIISDREYEFYKDFDLSAEPYTTGYENDFFINYKPDFLFTGTSYTSKIELKFLKEANKLNIPTYSFIDHYTNFEERFLFENDFVYPEKICVTDEKAKTIGLGTAIPKDKFMVTGNFYHEWLLGWKPSVSRNELFTFLRIPLDSKLIVYAPDPLTNVGGIERFGLDETTVFENIKTALSSTDYGAYSLVIKPHPNQNKNWLLPHIPTNDKRYIIFHDGIDINALLYYSDVVIGIFSSILIESSLMKKKVIRCLINFKETDPLSTNNIGIIVNNIEELIRGFKTVLQ